MRSAIFSDWVFRYASLSKPTLNILVPFAKNIGTKIKIFGGILNA
jgi:hypothetical protein